MKCRRDNPSASIFTSPIALRPTVTGSLLISYCVPSLPSIPNKQRLAIFNSSREGRPGPNGAVRPIPPTCVKPGQGKQLRLPCPWQLRLTWLDGVRAEILQRFGRETSLPAAHSCAMLAPSAPVDHQLLTINPQLLYDC